MTISEFRITFITAPLYVCMYAPGLKAQRIGSRSIEAEAPFFYSRCTPWPHRVTRQMERYLRRRNPEAAPAVRHDAGMLAAIMTRAQPAPIPLWPDGIPGGWTSARSEIVRDSGSGRELLEHVAEPRLIPFPIERPGPVVIIIPGGGYHILAWEHEGKDVARFLNQRGFGAYVLLHRLPEPRGLENDRSPCLQDAERALQIVRERHPGEKAGLMGFSAGGHLSAWTASQAAERPDFLALIYPAYLSDGLQIRADVAPGPLAPPAFLVHTMDDGIPVEGTLAYAAAMRAEGRPAEAHIHPHGGHGYGLLSPEPGLRDWGLRLADWLETLRQSA